MYLIAHFLTFWNRIITHKELNLCEKSCLTSKLMYNTEVGTIAKS